MTLEALPDIGAKELGALGSIGILLFAIYRYKAGNLESARERENRLKNLEGKSVKQGGFVVTVDNIDFDEKGGFYYRLKRTLLSPVQGTIYVTVRLQEIGVPEELWEMDHAQAFYNTLEFPVECVNSQITPQHTALVFKLESGDYLDLKQFLDHLTNFFYSLEDSGAVSIV
jgi:hypothetical protein